MLKNRHVMTASDIAARLQTFSHPWNAKSEMRGVQMAPVLGLTRLGVNFIRIAPGREAYVQHAHQREEEWVYILEGEAIVLIDDEEVRVEPGDFIAYPSPQPVHHLKNAGRVDLVCLMGGEQLAVDVVDFPTKKKRLVWVDGRATAYPIAFGEDPFVPKPPKPPRPPRKTAKAAAAKPARKK